MWWLLKSWAHYHPKEALMPLCPGTNIARMDQNNDLTFALWRPFISYLFCVGTRWVGFIAAGSPTISFYFYFTFPAIKQILNYFIPITIGPKNWNFMF